MKRQQIEPWALRLTWLLAPLVIGRGLSTSLSEVAPTAKLVIEVALWAAWFVGLVAVFFAHPISLTMIRVLATSAAAVSTVLMLVSLLSGSQSNDQMPLELVSAAGFGLLASIVALLPSVGDLMVNGSAYGSERRMALRPPGATLIGPVPLAWLGTFAGLVGWAFLVAQEYYLLGALAALAGAGLIWAGGRMLHQLGRRWIVFVPAGFVLHDLLNLTEPVLIKRSDIAKLGPARADDDSSSDTDTGKTERLDLSGGALGLALEVEAKAPLKFALRQGRRDDKLADATNILFTPSLPGALLQEARVRGVKIGDPGTD